jgi:hypothetical protein
VDVGAVEIQGVSRVKLTAESNQKASTDEAALFKIGSFTDSNSKGPFIIDIDWGDGSPETLLSLNAPGAIPAQSHTFSSASVSLVSVFVTDPAGIVSAPATFKITVT